MTARLKQHLRKFPFLFALLKLWYQVFLSCFHLFESFLLLVQARILSRQYRHSSWQHETRAKPHLLLLTDFNLPSGYDCDTAYELWGLSLQEADICTFTRLILPNYLPAKLRFIRQLFEVCSKGKPDYLFLALGGNPAIFPPPQCWDILCKALPIPFFVLLADSLPEFIKYLENICCLRGVVSIDASEPCRNSPILKNKFCYTPQSNLH